MEREEFNADWSRKYREGDQEVIALGGAYAHFGAIVTRLSESFGRPIVALDLGCGTGRYFHCLKNVYRLVGSDLSEDMLDLARNPVHGGQIDIGSIELVAGDVFSAPLPEGNFDFVYSIGVLGEYTPIDSVVIDRLFRLARTGGVVYFTVVDTHSRVHELESAKSGFARRVFRKLFPALPKPLRQWLNLYFSPCYTTRAQMERLMRASGFARFGIEPYAHPSGWRGTHLEIFAWKT